MISLGIALGIVAGMILPAASSAALTALLTACSLCSLLITRPYQVLSYQMHTASRSRPYAIGRWPARRTIQLDDL